MNKNKKPRITDVSLSESTIAVSLSAIRQKCQELLDASGEIQSALDDSRELKKLPEGANDPNDHGT